MKGTNTRILITSILILFLSNTGWTTAASIPTNQQATNSHNQKISLKKPGRQKIKTLKKHLKRPLTVFSKKIKNTPPTKGDDLWILQLIFLVAFLSIVTFAASAIMLALNGMSTLWLTLMIIGGVFGVLPMLIIGGALLFQL